MTQNNKHGIFTRIMKMICIGTFGGAVYLGIEYLWRGYSSPVMFLLAFIVSQILMILNDTLFVEGEYFELQVLTGTFFCTVFEWLFGIIFNTDYTIWDYRNLPLTLHFLDDQVNLIFCLAWLFICTWGIPLMDFVQYKCDLGEKPHYRFLFIDKILSL